MDRCKEIYPHILHNFGPVGQLSCSQSTTLLDHYKQGIGYRWPCAILGLLVFLPFVFDFLPHLQILWFNSPFPCGRGGERNMRLSASLGRGGHYESMRWVEWGQIRSLGMSRAPMTHLVLDLLSVLCTLDQDHRTEQIKDSNMILSSKSEKNASNKKHELLVYI